MIDNKQIQRINKILQKQIVQKFGVFAVMLLVVGSVAYFGTHQNQSSHAAGLGVLSMSPASGTLTQGSNVTVTLSEDSGTDTVNTVQASVAYDTAQLQYVSLSEGTAFPTVAATSTGTPGLIRVGRATPAASPVSGQNTIVSLTFKVLGTSGTTNLTFDPAFSFIVRSTDNVNILNSTTPANFSLKLPAPTISSVTPATGPTAGGTVVTITGANFVSGASVTVGGTPATNVSFVNSTTLTAAVPSHVAGPFSLILTNPDGQTATKAGGYTYIAPAPTISTISPASGPSAGGTSVTISGTNFVSGAAVKVGSTTVAATSSVVVSSTTMTAVMPAHAAGAVELLVVNPDGQIANSSASQQLFTYTVPAPTISSVSPASGPVAGGTTLTLNGTNLVNVISVTVGGVAATNIAPTPVATSITAVTPAHAAGAVSVVVTTATGTATKTSAFTYLAPTPSVVSVSPAIGTANGGTTLTISGSNFASGAVVSLGGILATNVVVVNSGTLTATAPAHASGITDVSVGNAGNTAAGTLTGGFTYLPLGDANNDGRVNAIDLSILISHDGQNYPPADFNGDGTVGSADLAILLGRWTW